MLINSSGFLDHHHLFPLTDQSMIEHLTMTLIIDWSWLSNHELYVYASLFPMQVDHSNSSENPSNFAFSLEANWILSTMTPIHFALIHKLTKKRALLS